MAIFHLRSNPLLYIGPNSYRIALAIGGPAPFPQRTVEASTVKELSALLDVYERDANIEAPGIPMQLSATFARANPRGTRKPNGYDKTASDRYGPLMRFVSIENCPEDDMGRTREQRAAPAVELTPIGEQYVVPGCERDKARGAAQGGLWD